MVYILLSIEAKSSNTVIQYTIYELPDRRWQHTRQQIHSFLPSSHFLLNPIIVLTRNTGRTTGRGGWVDHAAQTTKKVVFLSGFDWLGRGRKNVASSQQRYANRGLGSDLRRISARPARSVPSRAMGNPFDPYRHPYLLVSRMKDTCLMIKCRRKNLLQQGAR